MAENEPKTFREFEIPELKGLPENIGKLWNFSVCFTQWVDNEKAFCRTSQQVIAHRLLTALEDGKAVRWLEADWKRVCELLESTEVDFVPGLESRDEKGENPQAIVPPPALGRLYVGTILSAKRVGDGEEKPEPVSEVKSNGTEHSVTSHNQTGGVTAAHVAAA